MTGLEFYQDIMQGLFALAVVALGLAVFPLK